MPNWPTSRMSSSYVLVAALCTLLVLQVAGIRERAIRGVPPRADEIAELHLGSSVVGVSLRDGEGLVRDLGSLLPRRCTILVVYSVGCPWSRRLAESSQAGLQALSVPTMWVATPEDSPGAIAFHREHRLPPPYLQLSSWRGVAELGVRATPWAFWVGSDGGFLGPVDLMAPHLPASCQS